MAVIVNKNISGKKCWACNREIGEDDATILTTGATDLLYMHTGCAKSISRQLLRDLAQLADLGYMDEDE